MTIEQGIAYNTILSDEIFPDYTAQFLELFDKFIIEDIRKGIYLNFEIKHTHRKKINPILKLAKPKDTRKIVSIYKELYNGTYPYKEMENEDEVRMMINNPDIQWILFMDQRDKLAGCITFVLDFKDKKGYIRGFMLKKQYQGKIDIVKAMIGSMIGMCFTYKDEIFVWYVENRTAHAKSQYSMRVCGISPIAFHPNKDIFLNKVESDLMQILYDERALQKYRSKKIPKIIAEALNCFVFSDKKYNLGPVKIDDLRLVLDENKLTRINKELTREVNKIKFGYETIKISLNNSDSYFKFLYTPTVQNFEKTEYKVNNLEELYIFVQEFKKCALELNIRYTEVFVSAYKPDHQKILLEAGLSPRGYIPSWNYNQKKNVFEDCILFNEFKGKIDKNIQLISEGKELLNCLNLI